MQPIVQTGHAGLDAARSDDDRSARMKRYLLEAVTEGRVMSVAPHTVSEEHPDAANLTDHLFVLGPVQCSGG